MSKSMKVNKWVKIIVGIIGAIVLCVLLFLFIFWGIIPAKSGDVRVDISGEVSEIEREDGRIEMSYDIYFDFTLTNGKCIDVRSEMVSYDNMCMSYTPYAQVILPFDDRGEYPNQYLIGVGNNKPFDENETITIIYRDKTEVYNLKELAEELGIQR